MTRFLSKTKGQHCARSWTHNILIYIYTIVLQDTRQCITLRRFVDVTVVARVGGGMGGIVVDVAVMGYRAGAKGGAIW